MATQIVRGCELAYDVLGEVDGGLAPFVWAHGLSSSRADDEALPLVDLHRIARQRTVLRYDARGHGESGDLTESRQGDWAELALDLIGLLDELGTGEVVLGGASMGTATALHAALSLGDRVGKLVLVIPPTAWESRQAQVDTYRQMAAVVERDGVEPLIAGMDAVPSPDPLVGDDAWTTKRQAALRAASPERLAAVFRGAAFADLPDPAAIATLDVPTLILAWSGDPGHPVSTAMRLGELLADCEVVVSSTADDLATWTDRTLEFLARASADGVRP